jgi:acetamidase/formamidase
MATTHEFPTDRVHFTWDADNEPVLTIESGDTVVYETREVSDNQITPDSTAEDIATLDWDRVYPLAGPVLVEGAESGDTLAIEILAMETRGWGYTMIIPGFGLLPDDFPDPYIRVFDLSNGEFAYLRDDIAIPVEPFFGTMGVCPAGAKEQAIMPPGRFGGNMDTRQLVQGTTLYLPVEVEGALFSCGDAHAAQSCIGRQEETDHEVPAKQSSDVGEGHDSWQPGTSGSPGRAASSSRSTSRRRRSSSSLSVLGDLRASATTRATPPRMRSCVASE